MTKNPILLTEYVRQTLRRMVVKPYASPSGDLSVYLVDSTIEQAVESATEHTEHTSHLNLAPQRIRDIQERITRAVGSPETPIVALASSGSRYFLRQIVETATGNLMFLSHNEIPPGLKVVSLGVIQ
jgi:flagellar biosynthesis protein FlhA